MQYEISQVYTCFQEIMAELIHYLFCGWILLMNSSTSNISTKTLKLKDGEMEA